MSARRRIIQYALRIVIPSLLLLLHGLYHTLSLLLSKESQVRNSHVSLSERSIVQFSFNTRIAARIL